MSITPNPSGDPLVNGGSYIGLTLTHATLSGTIKFTKGDIQIGNNPSTPIATNVYVLNQIKENLVASQKAFKSTAVLYTFIGDAYLSNEGASKASNEGASKAYIAAGDAYAAAGDTTNATAAYKSAGVQVTLIASSYYGLAIGLTDASAIENFVLAGKQYKVAIQLYTSAGETALANNAAETGANAYNDAALTARGIANNAAMLANQAEDQNNYTAAANSFKNAASYATEAASYFNEAAKYFKEYGFKSSANTAAAAAAAATRGAKDATERAQMFLLDAQDS